MVAGVAAALLVLAGLDGAFAGFRSSIGRSGRIDHRADDRRAARRGLALSALLLSPMIIGVTGDVLLRPGRQTAYARAGLGLLAVCLPYGLLVLAALGVYGALSWRWKYLASAVILGPFTLIRPLVVVVGGVIGVLLTRDAVIALAVAWAVAAVLSVEPIADRRWYGLPTVGRLGR